MKIFGFELVEATKSKKSKFKFNKVLNDLDVEIAIIEDAAGSGVFVLRNALKVPEEYKSWSEEESTEMALIMVILSMIFINNNEIEEGTQYTSQTAVLTQNCEDALYDQLKRLGLREGENNHPVFGDWESLVTKKFVKQM
jgi:hypothetical protein